MSLAPQELENSASKYAADAIKFDSQGSTTLAIQAYQRAIEVLVRLIQLYPDYKLNKIYMQRASNYQNRIKTLQIPGITSSQREQNVRTKRNEQLRPDNGTSKGGKAENVTENLESEFDDLVLKDKPNVTWDQVIGLDDAKRAIRESIVYPTKRMDLFLLGWPRGILLYGPPGCGKTLLAAAAAAEIEGYFINVDAASTMSKWLGEAEKNV